MEMNAYISRGLLVDPWEPEKMLWVILLPLLHSSHLNPLAFPLYVRYSPDSGPLHFLSPLAEMFSPPSIICMPALSVL